MPGISPSVTVIGGGPAGSAAAIAATLRGSRVVLYEKSRFPRHKVCGEFLSPEVAPALDRLGVWERFLACGPARVRRLRLHFGTREKTSVLPEAAWALSRYRFDQLLAERASMLGVQVRREVGVNRGDSPCVIAHGRRAAGCEKGRRLFGFKAHFEGPPDDAVELFFFDGCYTGVTAVEEGRTNVCGLAPEHVLAAHGFDYDAIVDGLPALSARLRPLGRAMDWLSTGPLVFGNAFTTPGPEDAYLAGDALSFVDPFTGSGLLSAVLTGELAGKYAAHGALASAYRRECRSLLGTPFHMAGVFRTLVLTGWAPYLAALAPSRWLFTLTRPHPAR